ncbi:gibberellin-regulated protein 3-like [Durio zibethinus]|uniref:Gibberellin-regulated protein 3-like n=1 Tax=Durio zibethinus TaxID=66656 RepID=A0A6P6B5E3_DURZI|nr:gibberellin-regulated protein 3-like [Durio zibethinus]
MPKTYTSTLHKRNHPFTRILEGTKIRRNKSLGMASTNTTFAFLCLLLMSEVGMLMVEAEREDCQTKCAFRCSKSWKPKMCLKTCNTCCQRCNDGCVPPGPTANRDVCPCYAQMKTHGNRYKCP